MTITNRLNLHIVSIAVVLSAALALVGLGTNASAAVDNTPDCDTVAIIKCGVFTEKEMREKASKGDVPRVFDAFGISQDDLKGEFVDGVVWKDGRVTVDGKVVATGAMTAGRNFGGTPIPNTDGAGKYSTSKFVTEGQTAFVKMHNGKFSFAIIKTCGNPVSATPKQTEQPPATEPKYECVKLTAEKISRTKYKFTAEANASGGATIEQYEFGFGDGYGITVKEDSYTYEYKKPGTYETSVVVHIKVDGKIKEVTKPACTKDVTVAKKVTTTEACPYDDSLPKNSPDCVEPGRGSDVENCPVEGKQHLPVDSDKCKEDEEVVTTEKTGTPERIADTGPEALLGGLFGTSALGYGAYTYGMSRREFIKKALGR